jgi:3-deoxy-D-manno-octulosonic-acid transferase
MLSAVYNALWYPALPFALAAAGGLDARNRRERLGLGAPGLREGLRIWMHAASVGEVEGIRPIAAGLHSEVPDAALVVTTMTVAGREAAGRRIAGVAAALLAPLDCPACVRSFLNSVRPRVVLIAETELWPNYFIEARRRGARIAIVNGRISERSLSRYLLARPLFEQALGCAEIVLAQTRDEAARYVKLGATEGRVRVTGNPKVDSAAASGSATLRPALERFALGRPIIVAGSTAAGEDAVVVDSYRQLRERFPELALVVAPRHLERTSEVERAVAACALPYVKASALGQNGAAADASVMILDTMGELAAFYRRAAVAFVGGSLNPGRGGQNPVEPALASVPVLFGPFHENQREIASALLDAGGARVVRDSAELARACADLLADDAARRAAGEQARRTAERFSGGVQATLELLRPLMSPA